MADWVATAKALKMAPQFAAEPIQVGVTEQAGSGENVLDSSVSEFACLVQAILKTGVHEQASHLSKFGQVAGLFAVFTG